MTEDGNSTVTCRVEPFRGYWICAAIAGTIAGCVSCLLCLFLAASIATMGGT